MLSIQLKYSALSSVTATSQGSKPLVLSTEYAKCVLMTICSIIFGFLLTNTYRNFGIEKKLDEGGMHTLSKVFTLLL